MPRLSLVPPHTVLPLMSPPPPIWPLSRLSPLSSSGTDLGTGSCARPVQDHQVRLPPQRERQAGPRQIQDLETDPVWQHQAEDRRVRVLINATNKTKRRKKKQKKSPSSLSGWSLRIIPLLKLKLKLYSDARQEHRSQMKHSGVVWRCARGFAEIF